MAFSAHRWRAPITGAVTGALVAAAVVGSSALASGGGGGAPTPRTAAKIAAASINCGAPAASAGVRGPSQGPGDAPFLATVAQLVHAGTINQAQARVLDADIRKGRIDTDQLAANGTLSSAQAGVVLDRLAAVKRSLAPAAQTSGDAKAAERKRAHH
jgi:hypothetical protein